MESAFGGWLIDQAIRAGTVQTYQGIDAEGLHRMDAQYAYTKKCFGWVDKGQGKDLFQLCHVQPLVGRDGSVGLTTPGNLFTGVALLNQKQGNKPVNAWAGASIPASALKRKWSIAEGTTRAQVLQKLSDFLGPELDAYLDELQKMPQRTVRLRLARAVFRHQGDEQFEPLDRRYTEAELQSLKLEELQSLDAKQRGQTTVKAFAVSNCSTDSQLGVLHDELVRFSDILPEGKHRDNCRFMLKVVQVLGIYLVQVNHQQGTARSRFLKTGHNTWSPLVHLYHDQPWRTPPQVLAEDLDGLIYGVYDTKGKVIKPGVIPAAQNALQGLEVDRDYISNRLLKRLSVQTLGPAVVAPDQWSWKASGSNWLSYIDNLYATFEATWQALLEAGMCTETQILDAQDAMLVSLDKAVESARENYRNGRRFTIYGVPFDRYPQYLEFSPVVLPQAA
ncbi:hypothetical protein B8W72_26165 [Pseudomonas putida]|uniref:Uncharacterized protein n=1 Tax=Pseudomonas putida TaxID=303 RepID=A0A1Y3KFP3_PSEPU|nr:hypothetical protein [Pseudomonas putida]OUM24656.1 hypothetical protein B8W72_26165 [Pseudomonas putida]